MKFKKYLVKKGKTDLLSSLMALDKELLKEKLEEYEVDNINELKDYVLEDFEFCLNESKNDIYTKMYFKRLIEHENSELMDAYEDDIENLLVFVYVNGNHYSYYIPIEIKQIIKKLLGNIGHDK